jgi:hypothetical protein
MMITELRKNMDEYEETIRHLRANYEQVKVIEEEKEGAGALIIQRSKDRKRQSGSRNREVDIR